MLMPLASLALIAVPAGAQPQGQVKAPAEAPYATKLLCTAHNSILADYFEAELGGPGQEAQARAERWVMQAVAEKGQDKVEQDLTAVLLPMVQQFETLKSAPIDELFAWLDKHKAICEPYGG